MSEQKWAVGIPHEQCLPYKFDTREDAIDYAIGSYKTAKKGGGSELWGDICNAPHPVAATFYIGKVNDFVSTIDAGELLWQICDQADDFGYPYSEDYLAGVTAAEISSLEDRLLAAFDEWAEETGNQADFFVLSEIEELMVADYLENGAS